jgi:radical SAM protein with 4Fe4S-binding SPASM domain
MIKNFKDMNSDESLWDGISGDTNSNSIPAVSAPLDLYWEITKRCNLCCLHCYNKSGTANAEPGLEQIQSVVKELSSTKLRNLVVTGGEPLMRKDLRTIVEWLKPLTLNFVLATNGTLINESNARWMNGMINEVNLSLDAGNKSAYEKFRGRKGIFEKCIKGFKLLARYDIPVIIQTTISRYNINSLEEIALLAIENGAAAWIVRLPVYSGRAVENRKDFLGRDELVKAEPMLLEIREKYLNKFIDLQIGVNFMWSYKEPYTYTQNEEKAVSCSAGTVGALLTAQGTLVPCPLFSGTNFSSGVVWKNNFIKEWQTAQCMNAMRSIHLSQLSSCFHCSHYKIKCSGGCRAKSYLNGNLYSIDPDCAYGGYKFIG